MAMLPRKDRRSGGGGRRPPACTPAPAPALRVPKELTEDASESLLKRDAAGVTLRFCGRVERGRIAGIGGMLS